MAARSPPSPPAAPQLPPACDAPAIPPDNPDHHPIASTNENIDCPLCGITVPEKELHAHYALELARFDSLTPNHQQQPQQPAEFNTPSGERIRRGAAVAALNRMSEQSSKNSNSHSDEYERVLRRVHADRIKRSAFRSNPPPPRQSTSSSLSPYTQPGSATGRKRGRPSKQQRLQNALINTSQESFSCFMCGMPLPPDSDAINTHIDGCLSIAYGADQYAIDNSRNVHSHIRIGLDNHNHNNDHDIDMGSVVSASASRTHQHQPFMPTASTSSSSSSSSSSATAALISSSHAANHNSDSEPFGDSYEWNGVERVRATAITEGLFEASGFSVHRKTDQDTDEEVNVDDDGTAEFGEAQFGEHNLIQPSEESDENGHLPHHNTDTSAVTTTTTTTMMTVSHDNPTDIDTKPLDESDDTVVSHHSTRLVIDSLKSRVRELEAMQATTTQCLVCIGSYTDPLVSIVCWHVHCRVCWLGALSMRRVCPQCQQITAPSDLRRVFL